MQWTSGIDITVGAFRALNLQEQEEAFARIHELRLARLSADENELAGYLRSLRRVVDIVEGELTPETYRKARLALIDQGEEIHEISAVRRYFGTWRLAKEALGLSDVTTATKIEARFRGRMIGKPHTYTEETMREALVRCAKEIGGVPLVIEYEHFRRREQELAKARGEQLFLPSSSPFRRRWGSWEDALLALGFAQKEISARLEPGRERANENLRWFRFRTPDHPERSPS